MSGPTTITGLLLAAGAGRRAGGPKALRRDAAGRSWVVTAARVLAAGGCDQVLVVTGCRSSEVLRELEHEPVIPVVAEDWESGLAASLRVGLAEATRTNPTAVLVHLVDLPDVAADVVGRVLADPIETTTLRRADYDGRPGHPVLIGASHLPRILDSAIGDSGARAYLASRPVSLVPCGDLSDGRDVDGPEPRPEHRREAGTKGLR